MQEERKKTLGSILNPDVIGKLLKQNRHKRISQNDILTQVNHKINVKSVAGSPFIKNTVLGQPMSGCTASKAVSINYISQTYQDSGSALGKFAQEQQASLFNLDIESSQVEQPSNESPYKNSNQEDDCVSVLLMGQLEDPMQREKYSRNQLIQLLDKYEYLVAEIEKMKLNLRETTFEVDSKLKKQNIKLKNKLV
jgi:hypothetical protein